MSNKELLAAISAMLDEKLEKKLDEKLDQKLDEKLAALEQRLEERLEQKLEQKLDQKLDQKLAPIIQDIKQLKLDNETNIIPRLQNIEACYLSTYERYVQAVDSFEETKTDVDCLKQVVSQHSEQLSRIRCLA